jgi:hypothetical protein
MTPMRSFFFPHGYVIDCILKDSVFAALLAINCRFITNVNTLDGTEVWVARICRVFIVLSVILTECGRVIQDRPIEDKYV